jgi:hypothetical protein
MCSVTDNTTRIRIEYGFIRYDDLQLLQVTITETAIALAASQIPLTELHWADVSLRGLTDGDWLRRPIGVD